MKFKGKSFTVSEFKTFELSFPVDVMLLTVQVSNAGEFYTSFDTELRGEAFTTNYPLPTNSAMVIIDKDGRQLLSSNDSMVFDNHGMSDITVHITYLDDVNSSLDIELT